MGDILEQLKGETDLFGSVRQVVLGNGYSDVTIFVSEEITDPEILGRLDGASRVILVPGDNSEQARNFARTYKKSGALPDAVIRPYLYTDVKLGDGRVIPVAVYPLFGELLAEIPDLEQRFPSVLDADANFLALIESVAKLYSKQPPQVHGGIAPEYVVVTQKTGLPVFQVVGIGSHGDQLQDLEESEKSKREGELEKSDVLGLRALGRLLPVSIEVGNQCAAEKRGSKVNSLYNDVTHAREKAGANPRKQEPLDSTVTDFVLPETFASSSTSSDLDPVQSVSVEPEKVEENTTQPQDSVSEEVPTPREEATETSASTGVSADDSEEEEAGQVPPVSAPEAPETAAPAAPDITSPTPEPKVDEPSSAPVKEAEPPRAQPKPESETEPAQPQEQPRTTSPYTALPHPATPPTPAAGPGPRDQADARLSQDIAADPLYGYAPAEEQDEENYTVEEHEETPGILNKLKNLIGARPYTEPSDEKKPRIRKEDLLTRRNFIIAGAGVGVLGLGAYALAPGDKKSEDAGNEAKPPVSTLQGYADTGSWTVPVAPSAQVYAAGAGVLVATGNKVEIHAYSNPADKTLLRSITLDGELDLVFDTKVEGKKALVMQSGNKLLAYVDGMGAEGKLLEASLPENAHISATGEATGVFTGSDAFVLTNDGLTGFKRPSSSAYSPMSADSKGLISVAFDAPALMTDKDGNNVSSATLAAVESGWSVYTWIGAGHGKVITLWSQDSSAQNSSSAAVLAVHSLADGSLLGSKKMTLGDAAEDGGRNGLSVRPLRPGQGGKIAVFGRYIIDLIEGGIDRELPENTTVKKIKGTTVVGEQDGNTLVFTKDEPAGVRFTGSLMAQVSEGLVVQRGNAIILLPSSQA